MSVTLTRQKSSRRRFSLLKTLFQAMQIQRQRRALQTLDEAALRDMGLTRGDVERESQRPVWDAPEIWLK